jgi:anaerobic magnesium-protoporphyrin IX monomethyl ester cyclase
MANVILVEPTPLDGPIRFTYRSYAPLAVLTVAAPLVREGYSVKIIDQRINPKWDEDLLNSIDNETICVGVTSMTGRQIVHALSASRLVKKHSDVPVVWGGIHASLLPGQTLENSSIDFVVQGEGEETFLELLRALEGKGRDFNINGLWHKQNGSIHSNQQRNFLDLNSLPRIPFELVNDADYDLTDALPVFTSRGCSHRCGFCYNLQYCSRKWRAMSPERVLEDLRYYVSKYNPAKIIFRDDNFFQDLKRTRQICEGILKEGFKFRWRGSCRVDYVERMSDRDLKLILDSGFEDFGFGMESGSPKMLNIMKKDITTQETLSATERLHRHGILYSGSFVGGYPGETEEDLYETMDFITRIFKKDSSFTFVLFPYVPYPGTDAYGVLLEGGFRFPEKTEDWANFHFPHDTAVPGVGKENSFYTRDTPWLSKAHKQKLFDMDALSQVAGRPYFRSSSTWEMLMASPYNLMISLARYRWAYRMLGPVPEGPVLDVIRRMGIHIYRRMKGNLPKR